MSPPPAITRRVRVKRGRDTALLGGRACRGLGWRVASRLAQQLLCESTLRRTNARNSPAIARQYTRWRAFLGGYTAAVLCAGACSRATAHRQMDSAEPEQMDRVPAIASGSGVTLTEIGIISSQAGLALERPGGGLFEPGLAGFQHFATPGLKKEPSNE